MRIVKLQSIRAKLVLIIAATSGIALLIACAAFVLNDVVALRASKVRHLSSLAKVLGSNSTAALSFDQVEAAEDLLASLDHRPTIDYACILDWNGEIFAQYQRGNASAAVPTVSRLNRHVFTEDGYLDITVPIVEDGEQLGAVFMRATMEDVYVQIRQQIKIAATIIAGCLGVALLLAYALHRVISVPILSLADTAERISQENDYSIRVEHRSNDEIGVLYDHFNHMLRCIQDGESKLREARDQLELRVEERTEQLQTANDELQRRMDQRDQVMRELEHSTQIVRLLQEITVAANEADHVESAILVALRRFCEFTGWPVAHAYLPDTDRPDELIAADLWYLASEEEHHGLRKQFDGIRITQGKGLPGRVLASSCPGWTSDVGADFNGTVRTECTKTGLHLAFAFPVFNDSEVAAVLEFFHADEEVSNEELSDVAIHVGNQLGRVFERQSAASRLEVMHGRVLDSARRAGMAEVATGVLHNVGNVLNSVNTSCGIIVTKLRESSVPNLKKAADMIEQHQADLGEFITKDSRGKHFAPFLIALSQQMVDEEENMRKEVEELRKNIEHIKDIVAVQQSNAGASGFIQPASLQELVEDAIRISSTSYLRQHIEIVRELDEVPIVAVDKQKILQILVNLVTNAGHALNGACATDGKKLVLRLRRIAEDRVCFEIEDNGVGIGPDNLTRIFSHGFTTRTDGHGFGLHSAALFAREMGGSLTVHSDGLGKGAKFSLDIPVKPPDCVAITE